MSLYVEFFWHDGTEIFNQTNNFTFKKEAPLVLSCPPLHMLNRLLYDQQVFSVQMKQLVEPFVLRIKYVRVRLRHSTSRMAFGVCHPCTTVIVCRYLIFTDYQICCWVSYKQRGAYKLSCTIGTRVLRPTLVLNNRIYW